MQGIKTFSARQWAVLDRIYYGGQDRPIILYGGAGFSGKSHLIRILHVHHHLHLREFYGVEGPRTVIACRDLQDVIKRHGSPMRSQFKDLGRVATSGAVPGFHFHDPANGVIEFWHLKETDSFRSNEYYGISVDEASENHRQCANSEATLINDLMYPIRAGSDQELPMFLLLGSNPDGPGHQWLKEMFIEKSDTQGYDPELIHFIPATLSDHPNQKAAQRQRKVLESIENKSVREARLNGSWDFPDGMRFRLGQHHMFRMADRFPKGLPTDGQRFIGYDWGLGAPFCALYMYRQPITGDIYVYREVYKKGLTIGEQAKCMIACMDQDEVIDRVYADETIFYQNQWLAREGQLNFTVGEDLEKLLKANRNIGPIAKADVRDRAGGFSRIDSFMDHDDPTFPRLFIEEGCKALISEIKGAAYSKKRADIGDIDEENADHALTSLYFVLRSVPSSPPPPGPTDSVVMPSSIQLLELRIKEERKRAAAKAKGLRI